MQSTSGVFAEVSHCTLQYESLPPIMQEQFGRAHFFSFVAIIYPPASFPFLTAHFRPLPRFREQSHHLGVERWKVVRLPAAHPVPIDHRLFSEPEGREFKSLRARHFFWADVPYR